jgi:hypothetical protein
MQELALIVSLVCNVILVIMTVRSDRQTRRVLDESKRPHLVADLRLRRDKNNNDLSFLTVYNLNDIPAKAVRFKYINSEIEAALNEKDRNDEFRRSVLESLAFDIPFIEKGKPVSLPFGLQCPDPGKYPERCRTLPGERDRSCTWKHGAVIKLGMDYQDITGKPYKSETYRLDVGTYWLDGWPDHNL